MPGGFRGKDSMELVDLSRYQAGARLGTGADYEVRAAVDLETGAQVVLKRPVPQMIKLKQHLMTEARTGRMLQAHRDLSRPLRGVVPVLGYTEVTVHDAYFGDSLGAEYRVTVEERAKGIPLLGDHMARITGVAVGAGQNLFALHPLVHPGLAESGFGGFPVQKQLLDIQEGFLEAGYLLLDLRPQNIFYQPAAGQITVIDCGDLVNIEEPIQQGSSPARRPERPAGKPAQDLNDLCLEIMKFYATPQEPPLDAPGYREPFGLRPVVRFDDELTELEESFRAGSSGVCRETALTIIARAKDRAYRDLGELRRDLDAYFEAVSQRNRDMPSATQARQVWVEALDLLRADYWTRFIFDPEAELAGFHA